MTAPGNRPKTRKWPWILGFFFVLTVARFAAIHGEVRPTSGSRELAPEPAATLSNAPQAIRSAPSARSPIAPTALVAFEETEAPDPKVGALPLDSRIVSALSARPGISGTASRDLTLYLRLLASGSTLDPQERKEANRSILERLARDEAGTLAALGAVLPSLASTEGARESESALFNLVAIYPPGENPAIRDAALASLSQLRDSAKTSSDRSWFDAIPRIQAYLATTGDDAETANRVLQRAMGGQIDPRVKTTYEELLNARYSGR
jgi:hypothetical protein